MDTNNPVTNPSPKSKFQSDPKRIADHRSMIRSHEFTSAVDMALLEYQSQLSQIELRGSQTDMIAAAAAHLRMLGAMEYLQTLRNLGEKPLLKMPVRGAENLNHAT